eukprot:7623318-Pyramimonas_sp.AAC.1
MKKVGNASAWDRRAALDLAIIGSLWNEREAMRDGFHMGACQSTVSLRMILPKGAPLYST